AFIPVINNELNDITLKVWPNPAQSIFTIMVSNVAANQQLIINLVSMKGEIIPLHLNALSTDKTNRFISINPIEYGLIAGIYTVQVQYNGKNYTSKIFIQP
ncbi:MAG: T9SS type A sorting domain-containing protein, partial [Bacteroidia bacterium]|nr:T9SS type A sorting domain-containing protein [Bacteroidia bacterium]